MWDFWLFGISNEVTELNVFDLCIYFALSWAFVTQHSPLQTVVGAVFPHTPAATRLVMRGRPAHIRIQICGVVQLGCTSFACVFSNRVSSHCCITSYDIHAHKTDCTDWKHGTTKSTHVLSLCNYTHYEHIARHVWPVKCSDCIECHDCVHCSHGVDKSEWMIYTEPLLTRMCVCFSVVIAVDIHF